LNPSFTYNRRSRQSGGTLERFKDLGEVGLTAKYGITSQLILDGTYNPDYSQVEADAGQVDINLRSSLFFLKRGSFSWRERTSFRLPASTGADSRA